MKNFVSIGLSVLLCLGAMGAGFALGKYLDGETTIFEKVEKPNDNNISDTTGEPKVFTEWQLCTDVTQLAVGDKIVIAALNYHFAMSTTQNTSNREATSITHNGQTIICDENVQVITLKEGVFENTFALNVNGGYLYAASSSSNQLKTRNDLQENASWLVSIEDYGEANIVAQGSTTKNLLKYNVKSNLFACYDSGSTQDPIAIYKQADSTKN